MTPLSSTENLILSGLGLASIGYLIFSLLRARRHGTSIRHQVLFALVATTVSLTLALSGIIVVARLFIWGDMSTASVAHQLSRTSPLVAFLALATTCAGGLAGLILRRAIVRPVEGLTAVAHRIAEGEHYVALPPSNLREIRALTDAFGAMRRELEQRDAVEGLATDLWHELKNPVASIRASAEVLEDAIGEDEDAARRFAGRILEASHRLDALINDLLSLTRLESRGIPEPDRRVDLVAVLRAAADALQPVAAARSVRLELALPPQAASRGDETWIRRAAENLLSNAVAFTPAQGAVRLSLRRAAAAWEIVVEDEGPGVDEALHDRLFERFVGTRHGEGGTGLGLAIVRAVSELHGGGARLASSSAQGACFVMSLPAA